MALEKQAFPLEKGRPIVDRSHILHIVSMNTPHGDSVTLYNDLLTAIGPTQMSVCASVEVVVSSDVETDNANIVKQLNTLSSLK